MLRRAKSNRYRAAAALVLFMALGGPIGSPCLAQAPSGADEPIPHNQSARPNPAKTPAEAAAAMTVPAGFKVEVVACEPDLVNPVAMTFDERGKIWITESLEYPRRSPGTGRDRVKVLEDTDGDGRADKFTVFAEGLNIPSGIAVGHGGVWVANSPDILFLKDTDGDGKADVREVVATGFGRDDTHELPNSLTWGPDGWLYGWNGVFNSSKVASRNGKTYEFTCAIFRIHPRTRVFELFCEGTSNPWGIAIDPEGSFFASACVIDHLWHLVQSGYYIRQGGPYPQFTWPIKSIVEHQHQKAAYCGIHYFDSPAFPPEYRGRLYMGNIHGNCINVDSLERNGSTYRGKPEPDFLTANDAWFMPVAQKTGPDGSLYILDWYDRYHCYQDANRDPAGIDRLKGRLYRVRYGETPRRSGFDLAKLPHEALIGLLGSPNVYDRDTAQRVLTEQFKPETGRKLETLVFDASTPRTARMHALWTILGAGALDDELLGRLLGHGDPALRAWGVRAAGNTGELSAARRAKILAMAKDDSPDVRLQVAIAVPRLVGADPLPVLLDILSSSSADPLIPQIVWQNLQPLLETQGDRFATLVTDASRSNSQGLLLILPRAIERLAGRREGSITPILSMLKELMNGGGGRGRLATIEVMQTVSRLIQEGALPQGDIKALRSGLTEPFSQILADPAGHNLGWPAALLAASWGDPKGLKAARDGLASRELAPKLRLGLLSTLIAARDTEVLSDVAELLSKPGDDPADFRGRVISALGKLDEPKVADLLITRYAGLEREIQPNVIVLLTQRPGWSKQLLAAIARKEIPPGSLNLNQVRRLQSYGDPEISRQVKENWGTIREGRSPKREEVVGRMKSLVRTTAGDPFAGREVFKKLCAQCHKIHGEGQEVGPDITLNGRNDFEQLLSNVFDPSLVIGSAYQATTVATRDGRVLTGLVAESSDQRLVLKIQGGKIETIPRAEVEEEKVSENSLMPEDVEKQLSRREIADLLSYLCLDRPPEDPSARLLPGSGQIMRRPK